MKRTLFPVTFDELVIVAVASTEGIERQPSSTSAPERISVYEVATVSRETSGVALEALRQPFRRACSAAGTFESKRIPELRRLRC